MRRALAFAGALVALLACDPVPPIPTFTIQPRPFVHRVTAEGTLSAERATRVAVPNDLESSVRLAWLAPEGSAVSAGEVIARFDPAEMEERLAKGQSELASTTVEARKAQLESAGKVRALDTQVTTAELELDLARRFQKTDDSLFSRHDIIESAIDEELASARKQNASTSRESQRALGATTVDLVAIKQRQAQLKIDQARAGLAALEVRAPHAGLVTLVNWRGEAPQVGNQLWPGQEIAEIPDLATLRAEVYVLEADAGGLELGKPAEVVVEAHPGTSFPATISRVDAVAKPQVPGSPVQYFGVALALGKRDPELMKPGQRVHATLILEQLENALVVPRQAVHQVGGETRVFVRSGRRFVPRAVTLGSSSAGLVVVSTGLATGEVVALGPPPAEAEGASTAPPREGG